MGLIDVFIDKAFKDMTDRELALTAYNWLLEGYNGEPYKEHELGYVNSLKWEIIKRFVDKEIGQELREAADYADEDTLKPAT